jgi:hypothetical protein
VCGRKVPQKRRKVPQKRIKVPQKRRKVPQKGPKKTDLSVKGVVGGNGVKKKERKDIYLCKRRI